MTDLKPCPFCKSEDVHMEYVDDPERRRIHCLECGAGFISPWFIVTKEDLIRMWNRRA